VLVANETPIADNRLERILAFMVASAIGLSLISFVAIIIGSVSKVDFSQGVWPVAVFLPLIGLPLGLVLIISLLIISGLRRGREARDARK